MAATLSIIGIGARLLTQFGQRRNRVTPTPTSYLDAGRWVTPSEITSSELTSIALSVSVTPNPTNPSWWSRAVGSTVSSWLGVRRQ